MTVHSPDQQAEQLFRLSNEVGRIAETLARLSTDPSVSTEAEAEDVEAVSADDVLATIRARRLRGQFFEADLFADPAWDMMLELLHAEIVYRRVTISSLCLSAGVPATTALRWMTSLITRGLFIRRDDPHDGRRAFVQLSPDTSAALRRYFAKVGASPVV
jgi:DNA-binding MarR family transcriptional regulator